MQRQSKKVQTQLVLSMILLGISCVPQRPKFDPDAYRANHYLEAIVNEDEVAIYSDEPQFSEFACMHKSKWEELRKFVQILRIPPEQKSIILKNLDFINDGQIKI